MSNPLLENHYFPPFQEIKAADVQPAVEQLVAQSREQIARLLADPAADWSVIQQLENIDDALSQAWSPISHLNSVMNSDELRDAYNACLPLLSEYSTEMGQNIDLFNAYKQLAESDEFNNLDTSQQKIVTNALRDFKLSGIDLDDDAKKEYGRIQKRLSELTSQFSENVLDATNAWSKHFDDAKALAGLPENSLALAKQMAEQKDLDGYLITLDFPSYFAVMSYAEDRELRQEVYTAFATRASDQGPSAGKWDNSPLMVEILDLRYQLATLLGFSNYAELSLATKMAENTDQVVQFLEDLAIKTKPVAEQDIAELSAFAKESDGLDVLESWDVGFYSEKLREDRYSLSQEMVRPYFPVDKVLQGLFDIVKTVYGVEIKASAETMALWHDDARYYQLYKDNALIGHVYLDLYARENKRGGAWMADCRVRRQLDSGEVQLPSAFLVCNFNPPVGDKPALLTHNEVTTLFHEFGHGLHHLLTQIRWSGVSGINGVAWDAVELPSQFTENWCWHPESLALMSGHYETGEPLPQALLDKMLAAKNFQSGMQMVRQLEFSLFDFILHRDWKTGTIDDVQAVINDIRSQVAVINVPDFNRFQHSFSHIFAGGYAAGYYSYKWAEVLSADAFSRFEEEGILNPATGQSFLDSILSKGGSAEPMVLFVDFMGREPSVDALLKQSGIQAA